jgi:hypothetical protein
MKNIRKAILSTGIKNCRDINRWKRGNFGSESLLSEEAIHIN